MKRLFALHNVRDLAQLARSNVLLAFDYDGTLAPIAVERERATMRAETSALFRKVCDLYACAVISGRSQADVALRLGGAGVKYVSGNHGLEPGRDLEVFANEIAMSRPVLELALAHDPGIEVEDKTYSLAVHYRRSAHQQRARTAIHEAIRALPIPVRVVTGKLVINIVPERAANKGDALLELRRLSAANCAFYVGDDVTDEDVFTRAQSDGIFTVRIGRSRTSAAKYFVRDQGEIDALLAALIEFRLPSSSL